MEWFYNIITVDGPTLNLMNKEAVIAHLVGIETILLKFQWQVYLSFMMFE